MESIFGMKSLILDAKEWREGASEAAEFVKILLKRVGGACFSEVIGMFISEVSNSLLNETRPTGERLALKTEMRKHKAMSTVWAS